jgi:hypothetical protein
MQYLFRQSPNSTVAEIKKNTFRPSVKRTFKYTGQRNTINALATPYTHKISQRN